jgi:hypothetical protein
MDDNDSYEAMVFSANLPTRTIAFTYQDGGPPFCGGIFRITYLRPANAADKEAFKSRVSPDYCPLCGAWEHDQ